MLGQDFMPVVVNILFCPTVSLFIFLEVKTAAKLTLNPWIWLHCACAALGAVSGNNSLWIWMGLCSGGMLSVSQETRSGQDRITAMVRKLCIVDAAAWHAGEHGFMSAFSRSPLVFWLSHWSIMLPLEFQCLIFCIKATYNPSEQKYTAVESATHGSGEHCQYAQWNTMLNSLKGYLPVFLNQQYKSWISIWFSLWPRSTSLQVRQRFLQREWRSLLIKKPLKMFKFIFSKVLLNCS